MKVSKVALELFLLTAATSRTLQSSRAFAVKALTSSRAVPSLTCPAHSSFLIRGGNSQLASASTMVEAEKPVEIFRKDYQPLPYTVKTVDLDFSLHSNGPPCTVQSTLHLQRHPHAASSDGNELILDGDESSVTLVSIQINGRDALPNVDYELRPGQLRLKQLPPTEAIVTIVCTIRPEENTQLSGLYQSSNMYCTQCEAMGFRRITYYPDRPDNMAVFSSVRIEADRESFPLLLSNGNLMEQGSVDTDDKRHYAIWSDPFPKPSYLFALVAGRLGSIHDTFTTRSGRVVQLHLFSEPNNVHKLHYAMGALKRSMQWDEERFGLEYDLDLFHIVAVDDFNMGAMENKSLNIFNTAYVLADVATATDTDFERVEAVIGHEYFHNWTGNRVTCRTWACCSIVLSGDAGHLTTVVLFFYRRLVSTDAQGRIDGLSGPGILGRYGFPGREAGGRCAGPAGASVQ
jgi:aminopeptidase N